MHANIPMVYKALNLFFNDIALRQASTVKYLGINIDQNLTWKCHVECVLRRVRGKLYSINRNHNVMKILYQAHILPIIDYCDVAWVPTNSCHLKRLEGVHSCFVSYINTYKLFYV